MNIKKKFKDEALTIFCSRCKKRHLLKNCPLNVVSLCGLCAEDHEIDNCPLLLGFQAIYKGESELTNQSMQGAQKKPWQARPQGMFADPYLQFNPYAQWNQWQPMSNTLFQNQRFPNQTWQHGWRGKSLWKLRKSTPTNATLSNGIQSISYTYITSSVSHPTTPGSDANECTPPNAKLATPIAPTTKSYKTNSATSTTCS